MQKEVGLLQTKKVPANRHLHEKRPTFDVSN